MCSVGLSVVVAIAAQQILKIGLKTINKTRVSGIVGKVLTEMEKQLSASLEKYRELVAKEYEQGIEDMIADKTDRLAEIRKLLADDNPDERARLTRRVDTLRTLIKDCTHVEKQLPLL